MGKASARERLAPICGRIVKTTIAAMETMCDHWKCPAIRIGIQVERLIAMNAYLTSLALGLLAGIVYALFRVRSPAPPVIALVGLSGILVGEHLPPLVAQA